MNNYYPNSAKCLIGAIAMLVVWHVAITVFTPAMAASDCMPKSMEEQLIGRWLRPDGGYVLEIREIGKDGRLKAAYFNPRSINVARAELNCSNGRIGVYIEMRDVNYPGSKYNLWYEPRSKRLIGTYFQAVNGITYHIEFVKIK